MTHADSFTPAQAIDPRVAEEAVAWFLRLQAGTAAPAAQQAWQDWLQSHAEHARAWAHLQRCAGEISGLSSPLAHSTLTLPRRRRQFIKAAALLAFGGGAAWWGAQQHAWQTVLADASSAVGQRRSIALPDGSTVLLNTDTALDLAFEGQRCLRLLRGEVWVDVATPADTGPFAAQAFVLQTRHGDVLSHGGRMTLRLDEGYSQVCALTQPLDIVPARAARQTLPAGMQARFSADRIDSAHALDSADVSWVDGTLVAHDMPLSRFLAEVARYRHGVLRCDPEVAGLRVSGVFPLADTDRILETLAFILPVQIRQRTRYWVHVEARQRPA